MTFDTEKKYYVYQWYIKDTREVFYVGKGTGNRYRTRKRENAFFMRMLNTHDCESEIIADNLDEKTAFELEKVAISFYKKTNCRLTNVTDGGENPPRIYGKRPSWWLERQSEGIKRSFRDNPERCKEQSRRMKEFLKTEKGKEFLQKSIKARSTKEFKERLTNACRKANQTPEYRKRMSDHWKKYFQENGAYESMIGENNHNAQSVNQYGLDGNFISNYKTITSASKATGVSVSKISAVCRGARKTAGGYVWKFATDKRIRFENRAKAKPNPSCEKPILQLTKEGKLVAEYKSINDACRTGGFLNHSNIICALKGRTKTAYGFVWRYK